MCYCVIHYKINSNSPYDTQYLHVVTGNRQMLNVESSMGLCFLFVSVSLKINHVSTLSTSTTAARLRLCGIQQTVVHLLVFGLL